MMLSILLSFSLLYGIQLLHPAWWWVFLASALAGALTARSGWSGFFGCGLGAGLAWGVAAILQLTGDGSIVSGRVATMLQVGNPWVLVGLTFAVSFLCGGLAGMTGYYLTGGRGGKERR
jgi:hypothetical protein